MGWLSPLRRIFGPEKKSSWLDDVWDLLTRGAATKSGANVSLETALRVSTVLACARVMAEDVASNPWRVVRETKSGFAEQASDHPLYDVLENDPNDWQTGFEFRETLMWHAMLCGQGYSFKNVVRGAVSELIPFEPRQVVVDRADDYALTYRVTASGKQQVFPAESIWHFRGPSFNSWFGLDIVRQAREAIGLAIATEEAHAALHANGVSPSGIYSIDGSLDDAQHTKLAAWIKANHTGGQRGGFLLLDRAAKWTQQSMTGVDAQHLETRRYQVEEICRAMRVMPIMVGHSDKLATYASAEQMFIAHNNNVGKWCRRLDKSGDKNLLTRRDRERGYKIRHQINALVYADTKAKAAWYTALYMIGAINPNEIRGFEHMKPYDDGEQFRVPVNMIDPATEAAAVASDLRKALAGDLGTIMAEGALEAKVAGALAAQRRGKRLVSVDEQMMAAMSELLRRDPPARAPEGE